LEALSMPCSVTTAAISLKLADKVVVGARMETPL
jgi:hypothetical protein